MKIVLAGPPRSGKSCLREGVKQAIRALADAPYPYVITGCPDGEGAWFQATVERSPADAAVCKAAYKAKFTPEFVQRVAESVRTCSLPLVLVDIGGVPSQENEQICDGADAVVILSSDPAAFATWRAFAAKVGLVVIAEVDSRYHDDDDTVGLVDQGVLRGSVHHLERGEAIADRPMVQALAAHVVALCTN